MELEGIENCPNKCDKVFDQTQYAISNEPNQTTFEYRSCLIGCAQCQAELAANPTHDTCFLFCKNYNYAANGIRKGVIEPDKACIMGCVINTCQQICYGGTTDPVVTANNSQFFWGYSGHGCSLKSDLGYVQSPLYGNADGPSGEGASNAVSTCCTQAYNLCNYVGDTSSTNYANVLLVTQRKCKQFVSSQTTADICNFYNGAQNCGTQGLIP